MFEFKHPKYYKNLRKLYRSRNRDGAISLQAGTPDARRTPRTGFKPQASSLKHQASGAASSKLQAPSNKLQAASH